ncbi:OBAP family protein [Saccharomonospora iraqiensis]|uniref:OBAP family protein n=1 Tax=Saccharomonospora iraqiensis TaxID=52698 RepID=UPI00022E2011|nr:OBAP family protein [Saccharomonospora iraqiensis]
MANPTIKDRRPPLTPAGQGKGVWLGTLEQGANLLQDTTPLRGFDVYVVGFHCAKGRPEMQMEAHHYCRVVNDDLLQCVIFDGNTRDANLIGIEYIVSERVFDPLPEEEKDYWHPHNYEVLSGQLAAPGLPDAAEKAFLRLLLNSYGKTWHTWHTGRHDGEPGTDLPRGEPTLMWSFNRDGECDESLEQDRNTAMNLDTQAKHEQRQSFVDLAHPQRGVDTMADDFTGTTPIPGVVDVRHRGSATD